MWNPMRLESYLLIINHNISYQIATDNKYIPFRVCCPMS